MSEDSYKYLSPTVQKALDVLFVFMSEKSELTLTEIAQTLEIPTTTVFRALVNLEVRGLVEQNKETGKYRLGLRAFELGMHAWKNVNLQTLARPYLVELSATTGETIMLGIPSEDEVLYLDRVDSAKVVRAASSPGQRRPLYCTAIGKIFLADLPAYEVARIARERGLAPRTSKTVTTVEQLTRDLEVIRRNGYCVDLGEFEEDLCCVATPIRNAIGQVVAAIGVAGPLARFDGKTQEELITLMQSTANAISTKLGFYGFLHIDE